MANILVVDDDEKIRELFSTRLSWKGHYVLTASHGQKGIDVFRRERPYVTILDFEMSDMDGLAVLRQIREIDPRAPRSHGAGHSTIPLATVAGLVIRWTAAQGSMGQTSSGCSALRPNQGGH